MTLVFVTEAFIQGGMLAFRKSLSLQLLETKNEDKVLYKDDDAEETKERIKKTRWESLSPSVQDGIRKKAQKRAIRNKEKRESADDKKRKMMMFYKKVEQKAKRESRVQRPLQTNSPDRVKLVDVSVGDVRNGTVISITDFGAYVDIGSECDALLHVSQITRKEFVEHPRQILSPGEEIEVTVSRVSPELKKMQVSMLSEKELQMETKVEDDADERIPLEDLNINDELWGEIKRVTAYGAYVELGTAVQGWLHFMDHPEFGIIPGAKPHEYMEVGDRIRCWVSQVDEELNRIKLTANRPEDLPGPRRETIKRLDFN